VIVLPVLDLTDVRAVAGLFGTRLAFEFHFVIACVITWFGEFAIVVAALFKFHANANHFTSPLNSEIILKTIIILYGVIDVVIKRQLTAIGFIIYLFRVP
jgi:hypothetical protein